MGEKMLLWAGLAAEPSPRPRASLEGPSLGRGTASRGNSAGNVRCPVERGRGARESQSGGPILGILPRGGCSL